MAKNAINPSSTNSNNVAPAVTTDQFPSINQTNGVSSEPVNANLASINHAGEHKNDPMHQQKEAVINDISRHSVETKSHLKHVDGALESNESPSNQAPIASVSNSKSKAIATFIKTVDKSALAAAMINGEQSANAFISNALNKTDLANSDIALIADGASKGMSKIVKKIEGGLQQGKSISDISVKPEKKHLINSFTQWVEKEFKAPAVQLIFKQVEGPVELLLAKLLKHGSKAAGIAAAKTATQLAGGDKSIGDDVGSSVTAALDGFGDTLERLGNEDVAEGKELMRLRQIAKNNQKASELISVTESESPSNTSSAPLSLAEIAQSNQDPTAAIKMDSNVHAEINNTQNPSHAQTTTAHVLSHSTPSLGIAQANQMKTSAVSELANPGVNAHEQLARISTANAVQHAVESRGTAAAPMPATNNSSVAAPVAASAHPEAGTGSLADQNLNYDATARSELTTEQKAARDVREAATTVPTGAAVIDAQRSAGDPHVIHNPPVVHSAPAVDAPAIASSSPAVANTAASGVNPANQSYQTVNSAGIPATSVPVSDTSHPAVTSAQDGAARLMAENAHPIGQNATAPGINVPATDQSHALVSQDHVDSSLAGVHTDHTL